MDYKEQIKELYLSGKTCKEIGEILSKSERTIGYHLTKMGI